MKLRLVHAQIGIPIFTCILCLIPSVFVEIPSIQITLSFAVFAVTVATFWNLTQKELKNIYSALVIVCEGAIFIVMHSFFYMRGDIVFGGDETIKQTVIEKFSDSLYFSIVTFTTLGYGDFQPIPEIRLVCAFQALFGYLYLGMLVALLYDALSKGRG